MTCRHMIVAVFTAMTVAGVLAGCSSGSLPDTSAADEPREAASPSGVQEQAASQPAEEPQASVPVPPAGGGGEASGSDDGTEEAELAPAANVDGPAIGPSTGPYIARSNDGVDVIYFEKTNACACMLEVGDAVEAAVLTHFQPELGSGELRFYMLFSNSPDNMDLVKSLGVQPFDLFIGAFKEGQGELEPDYGIWSLTGDNEAIAELVRTLVLDRLEEQR